MNRTSRLRALALGAALVVVASQARAAIGSSFGSSNFGYAPRVPVSALGQSLNWFDPSRLHISTSFSMGSGWGSGTSAMQVTSFAYQFRMPVTMSVSLGNAWGASTSKGSSMFLEGLDLGYHPFSSLSIQVHYRDFRSPLQYSPTSDFRPFDRDW